MPEGEMVRCFEDIGYLNRWKLQRQSTRFRFPVFVFRLSGAAFATNPFELYVDYSFRMKARCKARQAFIIQLSSNAKGGYLPTRAAVEGGSYGSKPVSTTVGPEGGDELVEKNAGGHGRPVLGAACEEKNPQFKGIFRPFQRSIPTSRNQVRIRGEPAEKTRKRIE